MKKFFLYIALLLYHSSSFALTNISVCIENTELAPYIRGKDTLPEQNKGSAINTLLEAAAQRQITLSFIRRPWARCLTLVSKGKIQGLFPSIATSSRTELYAFPSDRTHYSISAIFPIFYAADSPHKWFFEQLAASEDKHSLTAPKLQFGISAPYGYVASDYLQDLHLLANHNYSFNNGFKLIATNRLDGYIAERRLGREILRELNLTNAVTSTEQGLLTEKLYLVFNKDFYNQNSTSIDAFWLAIKQVREKKRATEQE